MSGKLLRFLNGRNNGALRSWLDDHKGEPRIAWYPSAGRDFRDLLYLHPKNPPRRPEPRCPDIFLHTDYGFWATPTFPDTCNIYCDKRTSVVLESVEELPRLDIPCDNQIVDFPKTSHVNGRVLFLEVKVTSDVFEEFSAPIVYAFVENAAFCAKCIFPQEGKFSHIVHIRFGGGLGGGGKSTGIWMLNILRKLRCECFITDSHYAIQSGDERVYALYPELAGPADRGQLEPIKTIPEKDWSGHGDVSWNILKTTRTCD